MSKPKILVVDIETAPAELWGWGMFNQNFGVEQVKKDPYILCVGLKWVGDRKVMMYSRWEHGEQGMLEAVHALIQEADAVVGKNSIKFDLRWLRLEFLKNKMKPLRPLTHIDLEKVARSQFRFLSNKLEYIGQYLGEGGKVEHEGFKLWRKIIEDEDPKYRRKMLRYCEGDVRLTERVYMRMRPWILDHPAMRAIGAENCPTCLSKNTKKDGIRRTKCYHIQQHQCNDCGAYFSGKRVKVV